MSPRLRKQGIGPLSNLWQDNLDPRTGTLQDRPTRSRRRKRLAFVKLNFQTNVYIAELQAGGAELNALKRFSGNTSLDLCLTG